MVTRTSFWLGSLAATALAVSAYLAVRPPVHTGHTARMTVPELIRHWGYPAEEHRVTTEDGYILTLHRIPHGAGAARRGEPSGRKRIPVLVGHCLFCSSAVFAFGPPERSLAYKLADAGYDVWLSNVRGNTWSHGHSELDVCPNCTRYWRFGFDEVGRYDLPALVDGVLSATGGDELFAVGYSMSTTAHLVALAERPEYNGKVRAGFMMGPAAIMGASVTPFTPLIQYADDFFQVLESIGYHELLPSGDFYHFVSSTFCSPSSLAHEACARLFSLLTGVPLEKLDRKLLPIYVDHLPAGSSTRTLAHYAQLTTNGGTFSKFDYGNSGGGGDNNGGYGTTNEAKYGQEQPPQYDLKKVTSRTFLYSGLSDEVSSVSDARRLASALPDATLVVVPDPNWTHCDFFASTDVADAVYDSIIRTMDKILEEEEEEEEGGGSGGTK